MELLVYTVSNTSAINILILFTFWYFPKHWWSAFWP